MKRSGTQSKLLKDFTGVVKRLEDDEYTSKTTIADSPLFQFDERSAVAVEELERQGYHFKEIQVGDKLLRIPGDK